MIEIITKLLIAILAVVMFFIIGVLCTYSGKGSKEIPPANFNPPGPPPPKQPERGCWVRLK